MNEFFLIIFEKKLSSNWRYNSLSLSWGYVIVDINGDEMLERFMEKSCNRQMEFRVENVIKQKGHKLHVKWKGYDNSFNS